MKRALWVGMAGALALGCGDGGGDTDAGGTDAGTPPVDAFVPPGADAGPIDAAMVDEDAAAPPVDASMPGQDAPSVGCLAGYPALGLEDVAPGYDWVRPVFLTQPPASTDLYVVDARGVILIVRDGMVQATPFLDIRSAIGMLSREGDERGLLGLAFHPDYATNGRFFVAYTTTTGSENVVAVGQRSAGDPDVAAGAPTPILRIPDFAPNHNGGMLTFGPDGYLYIGTGDGGGGGDPRLTAQDPDSLLGKMLRIDVDAPSGGMMYGIPADNPFVGEADVRPEIWAFGYRNPWRFAFDRATGEMYVADVGQGSIEEIDVEPAGTGGLNYGWSEFEGTMTFRSGRMRPGDTHTPPIFEYPHDSSSAVIRNGCSITGGYVYRGSAIPGLRGAYVFGDYCSTDVAALRFCDGEVREPARLDVGGPVGGLVSFGEDAAGELYVISFGAGAQVRRLVAR
ncbi:MAG: PQQ-dependent sugar dehydrogenase [Sandaracinaceae bacterium]